MSRPTWRVYEVRSWSWSSAPNTISTCSTVLRSPARTLSTRERTSRPPSWASAQRRSAPSPMPREALLEHDLVGTGLLEARQSASRAWAPSRISVVSGEQRLRAGHDVVGRDELLDHRRLRAVPEHDERARDRASAARPTAQRSTIGRVDADASRDVERRRPASRRRGQPGELVVGGQDRVIREQRAGERRRRSSDELAERHQPDAGGGGLGRDRAPPWRRPSSRTRAARRWRHPGRGRRDRGRGDVLRRRDTGVASSSDAARRSTYGVYSRLASTGSASNRARAASRSSRSQVGSPRRSAIAVDERASMKLNGRSSGARRGARAGRPLADGLDDLRHPSDPSISSLTSRLNSIAYSIGSSLVNTSRKPWMMRFWASFSVRPRLMR